MPTASEFRVVAHVLDTSRLEIDTIAADLREIGSGLHLAGSARTAVDATVGVSIANVLRATAHLEHLAAEVRHRAAVCEAYTQAYLRFLRSDDVARTPPLRPAPWVGYG